MLQPRAVELISQQQFRQLVRDYANEGYPSELEQIYNDARKVIYHTAFVAFLAGKAKAAKEAEIDYWSFEENDMPLLKEIRFKYYMDFDKVFRDLIAKIRVKDYDETDKIINRCELILQMLTWNAYSKGKLALWDDEILKPQRLGQAGRTRIYEGVWVYFTERDERVCQTCGPMSGDSYEDPFMAPVFPIHPWCRCELIYSPYAKDVDRQDTFKEKVVEENEE